MQASSCCACPKLALHAPSYTKCCCFFSGYSIGGILASALLVKVRRHCILNEALSKNLTCITFGQPHLPVPGLDDVYFASDIEDTIHIILVGEDILPRLLGILYYGLKVKFLSVAKILTLNYCSID